MLNEEEIAIYISRIGVSDKWLKMKFFKNVCVQILY